MFKNYRKKSTQKMRAYIPGEDLKGISVSDSDEPKEGGMIAVNEKDFTDRWYIAPAFFMDNYEEVK